MSNATGDTIDGRRQRIGRQEAKATMVPDAVAGVKGGK